MKVLGGGSNIIAAKFPRPVPPDVITLMVYGAFKLNREPHHVDAWGWSVFYLNANKVDWADSANAARRQLFGDAPTPESDRRYEQVLIEREARLAAEAEAAAKAAKEKRRAA